jgi:hypothetical protein
MVACQPVARRRPIYIIVRTGVQRIQLRMIHARAAHRHHRHMHSRSVDNPEHYCFDAALERGTADGSANASQRDETSELSA